MACPLLLRNGLIAMLALTAASLRAEPQAMTSEADFLAELPVVLSASRLAQPLADAPGAVTVIDRETIRASGAREIADLFRLVPGFQVSYANGANPVVNYHGLSEEFSRRMQVLVDGRSAYSPYSLGGVNWNLLAIAIDDIERIEVFRGSNSATYGANAFLGVANIITRQPSQHRGTRISATYGDQGVRDNVASHEGGAGNLDYRFTIGRRHDAGFNGVNDEKHVGFFNLRGDYRIDGRDALSLQLGASEHSAGAGFATRSSNPPRTQEGDSLYARLQWVRSTGAGEELRLSAYHQRESGKESFVIPTPLIGLTVPVNADHTETRSNIELQHTFLPGAATRAVWGLEARHDTVGSQFMFNTPEVQSTSLARAFGNLEWRAHAMLLLNLGATLERYSLSGTNLAPRLMLNFQPDPSHTVRLGVSRAYRTPSLAEQRGDSRYYYSPTGTLAAWTYRALGGLQPERVLARELSYLGVFRAMNLTLDARLFNERVDRIIDLTEAAPRNFLNMAQASVHGAEYQAKWRAAENTHITLNQAFVRIVSPDPRLSLSAPTHTTTLFATQAFPHDWHLSLIHHWVGAVKWLGFAEQTNSYRRLDLRLAHRFRAGPSRGEVALTTQNLLTPYAEYRNEYLLSRRAFVSASLEF